MGNNYKFTKDKVHESKAAKNQAKTGKESVTYKRTTVGKVCI